MSHPEWKVCAGLPDYEVSIFGTVRRVTNGVTRKAGHVVKGCSNSDGYRIVKLMRRDGTKKVISVHRLMALTFLGPPPGDAKQVAHWDGNPANNVLGNLRWATPKENSGDDRLRHGRTPQGEKNGRAILTIEQARQIKMIYPEARKHFGGIAALARKYGVSRGAIEQIISGRNWTHA